MYRFLEYGVCGKDDRTTREGEAQDAENLASPEMRATEGCVAVPSVEHRIGTLLAGRSVNAHVHTAKLLHSHLIHTLPALRGLSSSHE